MPSVEENRLYWDHAYDWPEQGDEWSRPWGGAAMQWHRTILPRIHGFVPTGTALEIGPGFGRWTRFLKDLCRHLIVVDLSVKCIDACRARFEACPHITYHVNDGRSLHAVPDGEVDFVFSFDSLVHAEEDVMRAYLGEIARVLSPDGVAFVHHSNLADYARRAAWVRRGPTAWLLATLDVVDPSTHARAATMSAARFKALAEDAGLVCVAQEMIDWGRKRFLDCLSTVCGRDSARARDTRTLRNPRFSREAADALALSALYSAASFRRRGGA